MLVGLDSMYDLMQRLENPHKGVRAIHVAGTKGKGSVCALLEVALLRAGYRAGRYSSPHVERVSERVSILGQPCGEGELADALTRVLDAYETSKHDGTPGAAATWFDVLTAAAFLMFREADLDWVVVEVGLGGRLDSTNVVYGEVAIVTNIELEHAEILGASREAIAREKVGILKPGATLVTTLATDDEAGRVLQEQADELGCPALRTNLGPDARIADRNAELAAVALDHLGRQGVFALSKSAAKVPLGAWLLDDATQTKARLPGRLECFNIRGLNEPLSASRTVPVVLDGAHIPFNLAAVLCDLTLRPDLNGRCVAVVALAADKDALGFLSVLTDYVSTTIFTELPVSGRGWPAANLNVLATSLGMTSEVESDSELALMRAVRLASETATWLLVTGSLHLVGALRRIISAG